MLRLALLVSALTLSGAAWADQVTVTGGTIYVTRADCARLTEHRPAPDVAYRPGTDVHGKFVAPADLPGSQPPPLLPDKIEFNVVVNPLLYSGAPQAGQAAPGQQFGNTVLPVAHVGVDLKSGETTLNGQPLSGTQTGMLREACRKAGVQ